MKLNNYYLSIREAIETNNEKLARKVFDGLDSDTLLAVHESATNDFFDGKYKEEQDSPVISFLHLAETEQRRKTERQAMKEIQAQKSQDKGN